MSEVIRAPFEPRLWAARTIAVVHAGVIAFFTLGWLLPFPVALWTVFFGCMALEGIWLLNRGHCPLTLLERRLRGESAEPTGQSSFVGTALERLLRRPTPEACVGRLIHGVTWASCGLAALHLGLR